VSIPPSKNPKLFAGLTTASQLRSGMEPSCICTNSRSPQNFSRR
jgi:hypothetical protein